MLQKRIILILSLLVTFSCNNNSPSEPIANSAHNAANISDIKTKENFNDFLILFSKNKEIQLNRIKYPFPYFSLDSVENVICDTLIQGQWQYVDILPDDIRITTIYDNFNHELRDADERVFAMESLEPEDDGGTYYYFKRINDLWYLVKREDFSY